MSGEKILLIDIDPQGNSTSGLGIVRDEVETTLYSVIAGECSLAEAVVNTQLEQLYLVPSSVDLLGAEIELIEKDGREGILAKALEDLKSSYRYIFIDCPPSLGLLTLNALVASDAVLVPVQCEYYALEGLSMLTKTIRRIQGSFSPRLDIKGIVLTMIDPRLRLANVVISEVRDIFKDRVFETIIHRNSKIGEAPNMHMPVVLLNAGSKGAINYLNLAREILQINNMTAISREGGPADISQN